MDLYGQLTLAFAFIGVCATIYIFSMTIYLGIKVFKNWLDR